MKQILLILPIFLLAFTMAIYPGETIVEEHNLGTENLIYTIVGNTSIVPELNVSINSTHITIFFPYDTPEDSFKLVFLEKETEQIIKEVYVGSSGSSKTKYIDRDVGKVINNTIYEDKIIYKENGEECEDCIDLREPEKSKLIYLIGIMIICILGIGYYITIKKNSKLKRSVLIEKFKMQLYKIKKEVEDYGKEKKE